jgi:hypothetical protein
MCCRMEEISPEPVEDACVGAEKLPILMLLYHEFIKKSIKDLKMSIYLVDF